MSEPNKMPTEVTEVEVQTLESKHPAERHATRPRLGPAATAFGCPRDFLGNRFVYVTVSARARGLAVGVNMNPDKYCNFDCVYCEVDRRTPFQSHPLEVEAMADELQRTLEFVHSDQIRDHHSYSALPDELLELRHVALSGDGEPTLAPNFADAMKAVVHVRARGSFPFFKIVLLTNASGLDLTAVKNSLKLLTDSDEVWAKLDAGTQSYMDKVNHPQIHLKRVLANILLLAQQRPVTIQSVFSLLNGQEPPAEEIEHYVERLMELKAAGAMIPLVQVCSAIRPTARVECGHLSLKSLSQIAKMIRTTTGLRAEVF